MKRLLIAALSILMISFAHAQVSQNGDIAQNKAVSVTPDQSQFSSLAYSNASNTGPKSDSNVQFKTQAQMGAIKEKGLVAFGSNLFNDQCKNLHQTNFFNPDYRITMGDKINLQMWGAFQFSQVLTVDAQGNVFVPEVGPIHLEGTKNKVLNNIIQNSIKKTFSKDVHVYADLVTAQPVQVYVTGFVNSPGLYDGLSSDSVIYYLCAAGGINLKEGSFRNISLRRHGKALYKIDLYDFILKGNISQFQMHQGDTIVVGPQQHIISVEGDVKNPYQYEWNKSNISLDEVINLANIEPTVTFVRIQRNQGFKPTIMYKRLNQVRDMRLQSGDRVTFVADKEVSQILITVQGEIKGPHQYILERGQTLDDLVRKLDFSNTANVENMQLYRESVATQQKQALNASLARLERQVMTTKPMTGDDAKAQALQSEMVVKFVNEAKSVETKGQVALDEPYTWKKVLLENNDVINIPQYTSVVTVSGDVINASSVEVNPGYRVIDYIQLAGGFDKTANQSEFLLMHQNGKSEIVKNTSRGMRRARVRGGDQIIVLPNTDDAGIKLATALTTILYQTAIAARVVLMM